MRSSDTVANFDDPSRAVAPFAPGGSSITSGRAEIHPGPSAVDDLEDVVDVERVVVELHQDAGVAAEDHDAFRRRLGGGGRFFLLLALGGLRDASDENHAKPAGRRHRERLRHELLAVHRHFGDGVRSTRREAGELGAALRVGRGRSRRAADGHADLLPWSVVANRLANDADRDRPVRKLRRRDRPAVNQRRVGHVLRRRAGDRARRAPCKLPTSKDQLPRAQVGSWESGIAS